MRSLAHTVPSRLVIPFGVWFSFNFGNTLFNLLFILGSPGGNGKTMLILHVSPKASEVEQTLSTLQFGEIARKVECGQLKRMTMSTPLKVRFDFIWEEYSQRLEWLVKFVINEKNRGNGENRTLTSLQVDKTTKKTFTALGSRTQEHLQLRLCA